MRIVLLVLAKLALSSTIASAQVMDRHMHSYTEKDFWVGKTRNGFDGVKKIIEQLEENKLSSNN